MKKVICLICTALVTCSLAGCASKNQSSRNNQNNYQLQNEPGSKVTAVNYSDGTYTGEGDITVNGIRQIATVVVSGGRITSVNLKNVDTNGYEMADSIVGNSIGNTGGNKTGGTIVNNPTGSRTGVPTSPNTAGGTAIKKVPSGPTNEGSNTNQGGTTTGGALRKPSGSNARSESAETIAQARKDLSNSIVENQSTNIKVNTGDTTMVNNWKMAVERALYKARR
jgi:uncharacterized protein with FMN-binding domain